MDMEQFKMVMDLMQNVTDGALTMGVIYMVYLVVVDFVLPIIITLSIAWVVIKCALLIYRANRDTQTLLSLANEMGIVTRGHHLWHDEVRAVQAWVSRHKEK